MSSPTTEVKPSQVAQLMQENAKLKAENDQLKQFHEWDFKLVAELQDQIKEKEHKSACLEADLEETTNTLNAEIDKLKATITKLIQIK